MLRVASTSLLRRGGGGGSKIPCMKPIDDLIYGCCGAKQEETGLCVRNFSGSGGGASCPSLSIWRGRKKEMGKEGLIIVKELKRLKSNPVRLDRFMQTQVSRLLKSDLFAVLAEFQRQDQVFLSMKGFGVFARRVQWSELQSVMKQQQKLRKRIQM